MAVISFLGPILTFLFIVLLVILAWKLGKGIVWLLINSVVGMVILILLNFLPFVNIQINVWSILIVALGGIPGIALVILLSYFGIAF
ncbi:MAG: pro-sigmaK processing inhibitor BofA family protein [archaeon]|nr:pro-sigmaK processing inhibitor BofA family protein [archaeon]